MTQPTLEEHLLFVYLLAKLEPVDIHSPEFRFQYFSSLILTKCSTIPTDALIRELEEAYMETGMKHPGTEQEFLFWAWADTTFDHEETEAWNLRYHMMQYHFNRCHLPKATMGVIRLK